MKEYRVEDIVAALDSLDILGDVFETCEVCDLRMKWLFELRSEMRVDSWGTRLAMHLKCDLLLSQRRMDRLRDLLCKDFDPELERGVPRTWWTHPHTDATIPYPQPVLSRYVWEPAWLQLKRSLNLTTNEDGTVVEATVRDAFNKMLGRDVGRMPPLTTFTKAWPMRVCFQFDGTGLYSYALCHGCLKNASYDDRFSQHSERLVETLFVAQGGDGHATMLNILGDYAPPHGAKADPKCLAMQFAELISAEEWTYEGTTFPVEFTVTGDLKACQAFRGSGACSPWCCCGDNQKHAVPFDGDLSKIMAADFPAAAAEAKRTCLYPDLVPVSQPMAARMGHTVGVGDALPPVCTSRLCPSHGSPPYASKAAWAAEEAAVAKAAKAAKTPSEKRAVANERTDFARKHIHQKRGEKFLLPIKDMSRVPVELLHHLHLNLSKMLFKWLIRRHFSDASRHAAMEYFASIGCGIDLKTKAEGRIAAEKWFTGAKWQNVVEGTDKHPGGLAEVITHMVGLMGLDLPRLPESERRRRASATERRRVAGEQFDETEALLSDTWGKETSAPMLLALRAFDAYYVLYSALNEPWHGQEHVQDVREARALRVFKAAATVGKYMEAGGTTHKSWTLHIAQYILFRHVARYGDLWRFSSGALEQRGAQLKRIGSCVACFRPLAKGVGPKPAKGKAFNSSAPQQIMQINNARQSLANDPESAKYGSRANKALLSGVAGQKAGRLTKETSKVKSRLTSLSDEGATCSSDVFLTKGV